MTEGIHTFAHYRQTYKAKQFLVRVLFIIEFVLFTRFYFQSLMATRKQAKENMCIAIYIYIIISQ
jgi:hypothetical protein